MKRLTNADRAQLVKRLMAAAMPPIDDELRALSAAAFDACVRDYFGAAGLRAIAKLDPAWLREISNCYVAVDGCGVYLRGSPRPLPCAPKTEHTLGPDALAAVRRFDERQKQDLRARQDLRRHLERLLAWVRTLDALVEAMPEAADLLQIAPPEPRDATIARVREALRGSKESAP